MDPAADVRVLVWRRSPAGDQILEVPDGKGWRLPYVPEVGLGHARIEGAIGALVHAPRDFDPGRTHRWVAADRRDPEIAAALSQRGAVVVVWRRGQDGPEVLVLHKGSFGPDYDGDLAWGSPGGALDAGETSEHCAARELLEETGLDLPLRRVPDSSAGVVFVCEAGSEHEVVLSDEHDRYEWVSFDEACARSRPQQVLDTLLVARRYLG